MFKRFIAQSSKPTWWKLMALKWKKYEVGEKKQDSSQVRQWTKKTDQL